MKAVICGAGIAGLALAQRLAVLGWEVVVLEKAPGPRTQGYMIDFFGAGYDAAEAMGVLPRLREPGYVLEEARFIDADGRSRARLGFEQFARTVGGRLLSIMRPDLESALRESLPGDVDLRFATTPADVDNRTDGVRVTLANGEVLDADLLVGADGIHSTVRGMVFGEERNFLRHLGFHTAAWTFHDPAIRDRLGDRFCLTDSVDRQIACTGCATAGSPPSPSTAPPTRPCPPTRGPRCSPSTARLAGSCRTCWPSARRRTTCTTTWSRRPRCRAGTATGWCWRATRAPPCRCWPGRAHRSASRAPTCSPNNCTARAPSTRVSRTTNGCGGR